MHIESVLGLLIPIIALFLWGSSVFARPAAKAYNKGLDLAKKKRNAEAITEFDLAIELDSTNANVFVSRALTYNEQGQYQKAIDDFNKVLGVDAQKTFKEFWIGDDSAKAYAYYNRGIAYYKLGKYQESIDDCTMAVNLQPRFAVAYQTRADAYQHQGVLDLAQSDRDTAKKLGYKPKAGSESTF